MNGLLVFLKINWAALLAIAASISNTFFAAWLGLSDWHNIYLTWRGRFVILGCIFLIFSLIVQLKFPSNYELQSNTINTLKEQLKIYSKIDPHKIISHILMGIAREKLQLDSDARISIYQVTTNGFVLRGRYSENTSFQSKGRSIYPLGQGCIGLTYQTGDFRKVGLPDPIAHRTKYFTTLESEYSIPESTSRAFVMKSRSIVGLRIKSLDQSESLGVVVVESTKSRGLIPENIIEHLKNEASTFSALLGGFKEELSIKRPPELEGAF